MTGEPPTSRRRAVSLAAAGLAIPAAIVATAGASSRPSPPDAIHWQPQIVAALAKGMRYQAVAARYTIAPRQVEQEQAVSQLAALTYTRLALPPGVGNERGLQRETVLVERAVSAAFPEIHDIGGVRPDPLPWHPNGLAIDVMIPNWSTPEGKDLGDRIAAFALANAERFGVDDVIWQRVYYPAGGLGQVMEDRGDADSNHFTHVHIATRGGGYPTGGESYFG